ncbi:hypothetical protein PJL18_04082 [Paenarthrobacter nicotinovorans]|nr:hypothetical protein [Paenarthrobacter nicotinovorans]
MVLSRRTELTQMRGDLGGGPGCVVGDITQTNPHGRQPLQRFYGARNGVRSSVDHAIQVRQDSIKPRDQ